MKIYRLISTTHLFSFGDNMGDVPVLGKSLYSWQKKAVEINSCEITNINSLDEIDPKEDIKTEEVKDMTPETSEEGKE